MKLLLLSLILAAALAGCQKPSATKGSVDTHGTPADEGAGDAVQLKEGHGIALHPKLRKSIDLKLGEVSEEEVAPHVVANLHVVQGADSLRRVSLNSGGMTEASGWVPAAQAAFLKPGHEVELRATGLNGDIVEKGIVKRIEKAPYAGLGEYEVTVETEAHFDTGTRLTATFRAPAGEAVTAVPRSSLFKTAEGWFVYTVNGNFFLRTAVKVGAMNNETAEITDGLYSGDQIVVSPVNTLWMAELQLLRGGKPCTCGH